MIRAVKSDLYRLPKLIRQTKMLDFAPAHAVSYNELVEVGVDHFREVGMWIISGEEKGNDIALRMCGASKRSAQQ